MSPALRKSHATMHKTVEWKEIEAGRLRPPKKKNPDETLQEEECSIVRLPLCRGALDLSPCCDLETKASL